VNAVISVMYCMMISSQFAGSPAEKSCKHFLEFFYFFCPLESKHAVPDIIVAVFQVQWSFVSTSVCQQTSILWFSCISIVPIKLRVRCSTSLLCNGKMLFYCALFRANSRVLPVNYVPVPFIYSLALNN
jgi:hypothetical protein